MARSIAVQDLVALPALSAAETVTLATQLETAAKGHKLAADPHEALVDLVSTRDALSAALRLKQPPAAASPEAIAADRDVDHAWSALSEWLTGWSRLGDDHTASASALLTEIFPDGLGFVNAPYLAEWSESDTRLAKLKAEHAKIEALGGKAFIARIEKVHAAYGKALGVTTAKKPEPPNVDLRATMTEVHGALREYAAKVAASVSRKKPKTAELAATLLDPLVRWHHSKRDRAVAPPEGSDPAPAPPASPPAGPPTPSVS